MIHHVTPQQALELISRGDVEVVDVREPGEFAGGHIAGARLVPLGSLRANPKAALSREHVLFVCAAGVRSETAARVAIAHGVTKAYNLRGGTRGWASAGLPLVRHEAVA